MKYDRSIHNNFLKVNNRLETILKITFLTISSKKSPSSTRGRLLARYC